MDVRVRFRFNKTTGEVELFEITDEGSNLTAAEHNREHDRVAADVANLVERNPRITEVLPTAGAEVVNPDEVEAETDRASEAASEKPQQLRQGRDG